MRSRGSQIRRLLLLVSPALKVTDSDSIQTKIKMTIIKKKERNKDKRKSYVAYSVLDFLVISAAGMAGLCSLQQASRRSP